MLEDHVLPQINNNNHNVTGLLKTLLGNDLANTFQHTTMYEAVNGPMNSQSDMCHVFSVGSMPKN
jgi:hypothetical protein